MSYNSFKEMFSDVKKDDSYWSEKAKLDFAIELNNLLEKRRVSRADLARFLGNSPAYITKILRGENNFTIDTMTRIARALDGDLALHITPKEENVQAWIRILDGGQRRKRKTSKRSWGRAIGEESQSKTNTRPGGGNYGNGYSAAA